MTGYESKRDMAEDKYFGDALTIAYQSGFYDGKKAAQKAQEPVAWMYQEYRDGWRDEIQFVQPPNGPIYFRNIVPVYDAPPQRPWVGLTEEEFDELEYRFARYELYRAIEAKLKEKNT